jgi:hypothetical protein
MAAGSIRHLAGDFGERAGRPSLSPRRRDALADGVAVGGHNVKGFDLPMLVNRAGVSPARHPCLTRNPRQREEQGQEGQQGCIKLGIAAWRLVRTFRRNVRVCAGTDASARHPYPRIVELDATPVLSGSAYSEVQMLRCLV